METLLDENDRLIILFTNEELMAVGRGEQIVTRGNPFDPMAKVQVGPLTDIDPEYEALPLHHPDTLRRMGEYSCKTMVLGNNDVLVFMPLELARTNFYSAENIAAADIDAKEDVVPRGGIRLEFNPLAARDR